MPNALEAEEHLRVIRSLMERATHYRALSAQGALVGGLLSIGAGVWMYTRAAGRPGEECVYCTLAVWMIVLALTTIANFTFLLRDERHRGEPFFSPRLRWALRALAPSFLLAGAGTWAVAETSLFGLGLFWSGLYAVALLAMSHFAPASIARLGRAFLAATLLTVGFAYLLPNFTSPNEAACFEIYMAATFGLFHLAYALFTWPRAGADPVNV
jgi:hypothetical protein